MLDWTQAQLAEKAGLSVLTIGTVENEQKQPTDDTLDRIRQALEEAGIEFLNGGIPGLRLHGKDPDMKYR